MSNDITTAIKEAAKRGRAKAAERQQRYELEAEARRQEEAKAYQTKLVSAGTPNWMIGYLSYERRWYELNLPGCSKIVFQTNGAPPDVWYVSIRVFEALVILWDGDAGMWIVSTSSYTLDPSYDLDEAIAMAESLGESWHAMYAEADRRNIEGVQPETNDAPDYDPFTLPIPQNVADSSYRIACASERCSDALARIAARLESGVVYTRSADTI